MTSIDGYIYIIIGLLGVAYPVLLQVIARLDDKYSSDKIVELFNQEWEYSAFRYTLISSLILFVIWSLKFESKVQINGLDFLINNSASILLAISTIFLVVFFFFFVKKILIYYTPSKFIPFLVERHNKPKDDLRFFEACSDLLLLFIRNQQTNFTKTLSDFFYTAFRKFRDECPINKPIIYPYTYYNLVYKAIEELAILKEKRNYLLEQRTAGGIWLLGEMQGKEISDDTYSWLWRNLLLSINYQQNDLIINHWETCHHYYVSSLPYIYEEYDYSKDTFQVGNKDVVNKRLVQRKRFLEFHYSLGGLLTYRERYQCIKRLFSYTQSQPPKYELLPESMSEIFNFYYAVRDRYERNYTWISLRYPFPELSGLSADNVIKKWICSYMAILFLRQYTIFPYLGTIGPFEYPQTPKTQGEINEWIDGLDFFKKLVSDHLKNENLLKTLNFEFITPEWCAENTKPYPITYIESFKANLESTYRMNASNLSISIEKVTQFENSTKVRIESAIDKIKMINNETQISNDNADKWYVHGQRMLESKDAFSENPEVHHMNFDSFLASEVSNNLYQALGETFFYKITKSFLFKNEDLFKSIDKLLIDDSFVIVNFGINFDYFISHLKIQELSTTMYKNISIYHFFGSQLVKDSLFLLKKTDLPNISTIPISGEIISRYMLKKISKRLELYTNVIDLNNASEEIYNENKLDKSDDEMRKSVLLNIAILTEFKWKRNIEVIQLRQHSVFSQKGLENKLDDIKPFGNMKSGDESNSILQ